MLSISIIYLSTLYYWIFNLHQIYINISIFERFKIESIFIVVFILTMDPMKISQAFSEILEKGNKTHITWLLVSGLMRNIVKKFDAVIFGGAVRDLLLHSYSSRKFYKLYRADYETYDPDKDDVANYKEIAEKYNDPTIHPELSDRFLLPTDIDFFITNSNYYYFKKYLYKRGYYFREIKNIEFSYINRNLTYGAYRLMKGEIIYFDKKNDKSYSIMLDIILCDEVVVPQMDTDFSVNKLLMSKKGIHVNPTCEFDYIQIKEQIEKKEAVCNSTISEKRYEKMAKKGWTIKMNYSTFVFKLRVNKEDENCIICLDPLKVGELEVTPKECPCKYSYCNDCIKYSLKTDGCLMCKQDMCLIKKECDIKMYNKYKLLE